MMVCVALEVGLLLFNCEHLGFCRTECRGTEDSEIGCLYRAEGVPLNENTVFGTQESCVTLSRLDRAGEALSAASPRRACRRGSPLLWE